LAAEAAQAEGHRQRALRRAARAAFLWPVEAAELLRQGRSLTELRAIGPYLERRLREWIESPPSRTPPPPERHGFATLAAAEALLARVPDWAPRLRGDLQMHTEWSDGMASVRDMAAQARALGYEYISITDHSNGLRIPRGIDEDELRRQGREIEELNAELASAGIPLHVLRSLEMNLDPQGAGDTAGEALSELDLVLGSFHSALRKTDDQTARYLAALRNPHVHVLGHPRGRVYDRRVGLSADWPRVFAVAAELDKALEVNCYPDRQDLDMERLALARAAGVRISIGTDAHHPAQLHFARLGLAAVLAAGVPPERIINFMPREALLRWVGALREAAA
jgi:DNA polymerase (family 10)